MRRNIHKTRVANEKINRVREMHFHLLAVFAVLKFMVLGTHGSFMSGVPCYLQSARDNCHYELKPGSEVCTSLTDRTRLMRGVVQVNRTLYSLEQQLIRLGIIPPDNACSKLPPVANGGVAYSDLNLPPGASGRYICNAGYRLHGGRHKYVCTEGGVWDGNVTEVPVECLISLNRCNPPVDIANSTVSYTNDDTSNIFVGDVITYDCEEGCELLGPEERHCMRDGNWSGAQPICRTIAVGTEEIAGASQEAHRIKLVGIGAISAVTSAVAVMAVTLTVCGLYKCIRACTKIKPGNRSRGNMLEIREDSGITDTPYTVFHDTSLPSSRKRTKSSKPYTNLSTMETTAI